MILLRMFIFATFLAKRLSIEVVHARSHVTAEVANYLKTEAGYTTIYHATHGILSWKSEQNETIIPK